MSTFKELVYMIMDQNKLSSDDSYIEPEHIVFMLSKIRAYYLKEKYSKLKTQVSPSNCQTICLELTDVDEELPQCFVKGNVVKSVKKVPNLLLLNNYEGVTQLYSHFLVPLNFTFVNNMRFNSVGYEKWQKNTVYGTIGTDGYLYLKSNNADIKELQQIKLTGVFEDIDTANKMSCDSSNEDGLSTVCDPMDNDFPLEEGLITPVLEMVGNYVYQSVIKPKDDTNNASDDMSNINNYLSRITKEKYK